MEHAFTWVTIVPGLNLLPVHTAHATLVVVILFAFAWVARRQLQGAADPVVPDATLTARNFFDVYIEWFVDFIESITGRGGRRYLPIYATFFIFILTANLMGLLPGFAPPTSDFNVTLALGVCSFVAYTYYGIQKKGAAAYFKHFLGPIMVLAPLMFVLEVADNLIRPVSLGLRLFGNMTGDHLVLEIFTDLTKLIVPVVFYVLGAFVSLVQAFVFTILSCVYLSLAIAVHEHHDDDAHVHH